MDIKNGDTIAIPGDYQFRAINDGPAIQRFWHHSKKMAITKYLPAQTGDMVLDVGCGSGVITAFLGQSGARVVGVDINQEAVEFATTTYASGNVSFVRGLVDRPLPYDAQVDKIYCLEVIEHVFGNQAAEMLQEFRRMLKPAGRVFLTTPNYRSVWPVIEWLMDRSGLVPVMAEHQHVAFYHRRNLRSLCEESGFKVRTLTSMNFLAPWLAAFSWRLAEWCYAVEGRLPLGLGCILIAVLEKE